MNNQLIKKFAIILSFTITSVFQPLSVAPRGRSVSHGARHLVYHMEVTQPVIDLEDRTGGAAPWTTSLASAA